MTEPTSSTAATGLVALAIAALGPHAGPYAAIVVAALAGALWALGDADTGSRRAGALLLLRLVATAVVLTVSISVALEQAYGWPAQQLLAPVAFAIGMGGDRWRALAGAVVGLVSRRIGGGQS